MNRASRSRRLAATDASLRHLPRRGGFTLIEAVATMTIVSIIAAAASRILFVCADGYASAAVRAELVNNGSAAMERIAASLRDIPLRPSTSPAEPYLDSLTAQSIAWSGGNSLSQSGNSLMLTTTGAGGSSNVLLDRVSSFTVQAYDQNNVALAGTLNGDSCDAVRRVQVTITLTQAGVSETLRGKFFLRSMMSGASN